MRAQGKKGAAAKRPPSHQMAGQERPDHSLYEHLDQRRDPLSAFYAVTSATSGSLDLDTILQEVIKKITEIFGFNGTRIFLFDAQGDELHMRASFETEPEFHSKVRVFRAGQGVVGRTAESGEPLIFEDVRSDHRYRELSHTRATQKARHGFFAAFPIKSKLRTLGTIVCVSKRPRRLTRVEIQLITSMAGQIGIAVENAALLEETRARANELSALYSVATLVNQSLDLASVLPSVMRKVLEIFDFNAARVYILDKDKRKMRLLAHEGFPDDVVFPSTYHPGEGLTGRVFQTGKPLIFEDVQRDPEFRRLSRNRLLLPERFRSHFFIPIGVKGRTVGVMNFLSAAAHRFSSREVQLIDAIANHIGIAVENSSLYENLKQSQMILRRQDRLSSLGMLTAGLAHEIRNPLVAIRTFTQLLPERYEDPEFRGTFQSLALKEVDRICGLVNNLLSFARPTTPRVSAEDVNELVEGIARILETEAKENKITIDLHLGADLPEIFIDREQIKQVAMNLILNAIQSIPNGGKVEVYTRLFARDHSTRFFQIEVRDTGVGIPDRDMENIFDPFFTTRKNGSGLGLSISHQIIQEHEGHMTVESKVGEGTSFFINLPAARALPAGSG